MGEFLECLQVSGNVGMACARAGVARQTAYRARLRLPGFARAWDAALVAAIAHAEAELAERAINGVEEAVYYHGEEVARRRRYDSRLLLAHLARLDKAAERLDVAATLPLLEDQIAMLRAGGAAEEVLPSDLPRDVLRQAQHERDRVLDPAGAVLRQAQDEREAAEERQAAARTREAPASAGAQELVQDPVTPVTPCPANPCPDCGGLCADAEDNPAVRLAEADCRWLGNRLDRMDAARPAGAATAYELDPAGDPEGELEMRQLAAFEAGEPRWWEVTLADEDEPPAPLDTAAPTAE